MITMNEAHKRWGDLAQIRNGYTHWREVRDGNGTWKPVFDAQGILILGYVYYPD